MVLIFRNAPEKKRVLVPDRHTDVLCPPSPQPWEPRGALLALSPGSDMDFVIKMEISVAILPKYK